MSRTARTFRKKPVVVEAMQFDGTPESGAAIVAWAEECGVEEAEFHPFLADHFRGDPKVYVAHPSPYMHITTPEGVMVARPGDWIIRGVKGEFYPCKPDIFAETYEPVKADNDTADPAQRVEWHVRVCRICGDSAWIAINGEDRPHTVARLLCEVVEPKDEE